MGRERWPVYNLPGDEGGKLERDHCVALYGANVAE
jgi:hypothetical protein